MAVKTSRTTSRRKPSDTLAKVDDYTILVNCMSPCGPCDALAKKCLTRTFKAWASDRGYSVVYSSDNAKATEYWRRYGKPKGIIQATPQVYVIGAKQSCRGAYISMGEKVDDYEIPAFDSWDSAMLRNICTRLGIK